MGKSQDLYTKAKRIIPGGTQLLSKRPEMFLPDQWPAYYSKAKGCEITDLDGNTFIDMSYMGIGSCILGYADEDVNNAAYSAMENGPMSTLNAPEEVELAQLLCDIHPWADMVRYSKTGGEALTIAVRIGRAYSGKDKVLFCGYHGWHDWYLASNLADDDALDGHLLKGLAPKGVPRNLLNSAFPFQYNDTSAFKKLFEDHKGEVGVIVLESIRNIYPDKEFFEVIQETAKNDNIALVVDEVSAGWRMTVGGAHLLFDLAPDIAVFAKGISNGYPMAAIIGKRKVMEAAQTSFISSTYWTDRIGPSTAIAAINKMKKLNVPDHLSKVGKEVKEIWKKNAETANLDISISGMDPLGHFAFNMENPLVLKTLFTQEMLNEGILATTAFYASYAHKEKHIAAYDKAVKKTFDFISKVYNEGNVESYLKGPVCHSGFKRLT